MLRTLESPRYLDLHPGISPPSDGKYLRSEQPASPAKSVFGKASGRDLTANRLACSWESLKWYHLQAWVVEMAGRGQIN